MKNISIFLDKKYTPRKTLTEDVNTDILIVGGGLSGISLAYHLSQNGIKSILVDASIVGSTMGKTAGVLADLTEVDYKDTTNMKLYRQVVNSIKSIEQTVYSHNIDCKLTQTGTMYLATEPEHMPVIKAEYEARKKDSFPVKELTPDQISELVRIEGFHGGIHNSAAYWCFDPAAYIWGLARVLDQQGVKTFENTPIIRIDEDKKTAYTKSSKINYSIIALTNAITIPNLHSSLEDKVSPWVHHIATTRSLTNEELQKIKWWGKEVIIDTNTDYTYLRLTHDNRVLLGGQDHELHLDELHASDKYRQESISKLRNYFETVFPYLKNAEFSHGWSGIIAVSADGLPFIGKISKDHYIGSFNPTLPLAFNTGRILSELIINNAPDDMKMFRFDRKIVEEEH